MGNYPKKEIELIETQIKRINKEEERRLAELKSKKAGGEIENFEKRRKRKIIESLIGRIKLNMGILNSLIGVINDKNISSSVKERMICFIGKDGLLSYINKKRYFLYI